MTLKLICGPTGSGKTTRAIEAFLAAMDRGEKAVFIAPSGPDARHFERRILSIRSVLTDGKVTTFDGLYKEFLEDSDDQKRILSGTERDLLLKAVAGGPGKPEMLAGSARFDGFISELSGLIGELEELGIEPARLGKDLKDWAARDKWRQGLNQDLFRLYEEYKAALEDQGAQDAEQAARQAVDRLAGAPALLGFSTVVVDGFYDFTPLELELVNALAKAAVELVITLPYREGSAALEAPAHYFEILGQGADVEMLESPTTDDRDQAITHIAGNLFEQDVDKVDAGGAVTVLQAAAVRGQAELVAAQVLKLWREDEIALDDMAVVSRGYGADSLALASAFTDFGIPFDLSAPVGLVDTPVGQAAAAALDLAAGQGGRGSLLRYLRSAIPVGEQYKVDEFDRYARSLGVEDQSTLMWEWNRQGGRPLAEIDRLAKAAGESLEALAAKLLEILRGQVQAVAIAAIGELDLDIASLESLASLCEETSSIAEKLGELHSHSPGAPEEPAGSWELKLFRDSIDNASVRLRSGARRDCIRLLDPHRVLNQRFDVVFLCGLLEGQFPALGSENSFLGDSDRAWLSENTSLKLPSRDLRLDEERFLFYRTLTRARHKIFLCYPYCDEEGKPTIKSLFVDDTLDLFEENSWDSVEKSIGDVAFSAGTAPTATQALLTIASMSPGDVRPAATDARLLNIAKTANLDDRLERCLRATLPNWPQVGEEIKNRLSELEFFRVTELETYLKCPFRYFIEKIVRPESMEPEDAALTRGSTVHDVLKDFLNALKPAEVLLATADDGQLKEARRIMSGIFDEKLGPAATDLESMIMRIELGSHLDRFIERERRMRPQFEPYQLEWGFGICDGKPGGRYDEETMLKFDDVKLCGRIDRVDIHKGTNQAVVIDYKTSVDDNLPPQKHFERTGTIQVPLYMLALREIWGLEPVGGEYYGIVGKRRRGLYLDAFADILGKDSSEPYSGEFVEAEVFEEIIETARRMALEAAEGIRSGCFDCKPREEKTCKYCNLGGVCRVASLSPSMAGSEQS
ncbi:MAG: PD-(D/E)XK nuclease family protein [Thermoleophilia bacterium]|nr:PD-(D/E)XK nuclease family protein [Thermoleophilia bacterium]